VPNPVSPERQLLPLGGWIDYVPAFVPPADATLLQSLLVNELAWENREIVLFGKRIPQPRLIAWAGSFGYRYSGQTLPPRASSAALAALTATVNVAVGVTFNHVLVNRYRNGQDSMGMHSDSEPELGRDPVVASVSFGVARRFVVVPRGKGPRFSYSLGHGDLLVMGGSCQAHYRHGVPRAADVSGERLSATFRKVLREAS
jgi:alkylated DNA repair dioxygenase AlkB